MEREYEYEVTIGIPVYNIEKFVPRMMDSVMAQTFQNIEILILDDCGTDSSIAIIQEYQQNHTRGKDIRIVRQPCNMGIGNARNRIILEAKGKYLYFLDGDDSITDNAIELLYSSIMQYEADIAYGSYYRVEEFDDKKNVSEWKFPFMVFLHEDEFPTYAYLSYGALPANTWNFLIKTSIFRENGIKFPDTNYWEDLSTTIDLPTYIGKAVLISDFTYYYYCRYGSLSNFQSRSFIEKKEIQRTIEALEMVKANSARLKGKTYFPRRMYKLMLSDFYITCAIIRKRNLISPVFTNREIRDVMISPLSFLETLELKEKRLQNIILYSLGVLPPILSISFIYIYIYYKNFIPKYIRKF